MNIRTDLAVESVDSSAALHKDIHLRERGKAFHITEIIIDNDNHISTAGKGKGRYITLEGHSLSRFSDDYEEMAQELAHERAWKYQSRKYYPAP